jgi:uncharacterized membrane protein
MNDIGELRHILPLLIPIVAIVMGIGIAMLALYIDYRKKREIFELHHKERMFAIERGMEVPPLPPQLLSGASAREARSLSGPADYLRRGLLWLLVGLAVSAALAINRDIDSAAWGLIPVAVGLAYLIFYGTDARMRRTGDRGLIDK